MAAIPDVGDPTLQAIDRILEMRSRNVPPRPYLGMSSVGNPCDRALWYSFRWISPPNFDAKSLKRFEDGHHGEDVMAARLRMVDGITLLTIDPESGQQYEFIDHKGHFRGHFDGAIIGLIQAPNTWHVWEHKQVNEKKLTDLIVARAKVGEKNALAEWDESYYSQAILYMDYAELPRHYLTVSSPGGRDTVSCRTSANPMAAKFLRERAERIIFADHAPQRISENPSFYRCRWCEHQRICHRTDPSAAAPRTCRTCLHSTPVEGGMWHCARWDQILDRRQQEAGCDRHLYLPTLVPGFQSDAGEDWVEYELYDGGIWRDVGRV